MSHRPLRAATLAQLLVAVVLAFAGIAPAAPALAKTLGSSAGMPHKAHRRTSAIDVATASDFGSQTLRFDEFAEGTPITTQYEGQGVIFQDSDDGPPFITWDSSNPTSPVLSGSPTFFGAIRAEFVLAGTGIPATVNGMQVDIGYIDDPGAVRLTISTSTGNEEIPIEEYGINTITSDASNISGFTVEEAGFEEAGFAIDNLSFTPAAAPPQLSGPAPGRTCGKARGWLHKLIQGVKCILRQPIVQCGATLALGKFKKAFELRKGIKAAKPVAKLYHDLQRIYGKQYFHDAPAGYRSLKELEGTYKRASTIIEIVRVVPALEKAIQHEQLKLIAEDLADVFGVKSCVKAAIELAS